MTKLIFIILMPLTSLFSYPWERGVDVSFYVDPLKFKTNSHVVVNTYFMRPFEKYLFMVNPKISSYLDKSLDISLGMGVRARPYGKLIGAHLFYDFTNSNPIYFHQIGATLEFFTHHLDYKLNFYIPFPKEKIVDSFLYSSHKWIEIEAVWKTHLASLAAGPVYNFTRDAMGAKGRITVPYQDFFVTAGAQYDQANKLQSFISIGFNLFSTKKCSEASFVTRSNNIRFDYVKIKPFSEQKKTPAPEKKDADELDKEEQAQEETEDQDEKDNLPGIPMDEIDELFPLEYKAKPQPDVVEPEESWWDWFVNIFKTEDNKFEPSEYQGDTGMDNTGDSFSLSPMLPDNLTTYPEIEIMEVNFNE